MIPIYSSDDIRKWDQYTIENEPIVSVDLMERAASTFVKEFSNRFSEKRTLRIFCGTGNNGGDGLAIGRILKGEGWDVLIYIVGDPRTGSEDFRKNLERSGLYALIKVEEDFPQIPEEDIIIDALFGTGLSRPLEGIFAKVVLFINQSKAKKVSVDLASGLFVDRPVFKEASVIEPYLTISFQTPKLPFFLPEAAKYVGEWIMTDIGLHPRYKEKNPSRDGYVEVSDIEGLLSLRSTFTHKGEVGRLLLIAGSKGKMGAAVLSTRAAFAAGVGLVNVCTPLCGTAILQVSVPEAMIIEMPDEDFISKIPGTKDTIALGPGMGTKERTGKAIENLLKKTSSPLVIDADGINILAKKKALLKLLPQGSILTPHPGEFKRLVGAWKDDFDKMKKLRSICQKHKINVVLKGAHSMICNEAGNILFNSTGNPQLATAGSGDVLTGLIGGLLAQGLSPSNALKLGVYVHGKAADHIMKKSERYSFTASDLVNEIPYTLGQIGR